MSDIIENADKTVTSWLDNKYIVATIAILLILYASYGVNRTSPYILRLFDMPLVKILLLLLIVYFARLNPTIAIIMAIAFLVTLQVLTKMKADDGMLERMESNLEAKEVGEKPQETVINEISNQETTINADSVESILQESKNQNQECVVPLQFRNSFYPQYSNQGPDGREDREFNQDLPGFDTALGNPEINGYDPNSNYAAL